MRGRSTTNRARRIPRPSAFRGCGNLFEIDVAVIHRECFTGPAHSSRITLSCSVQHADIYCVSSFIFPIKASRLAWASINRAGEVAENSRSSASARSFNRLRQSSDPGGESRNARRATCQESARSSMSLFTGSAYFFHRKSFLPANRSADPSRYCRIGSDAMNRRPSSLATFPVVFDPAMGS